MANDYEIVQYTPSGQAPPTPAETAMLGEIRRRESSGDYEARNPDSTASGAYQFINGTWKLASGLTGVPQYARAADAPEWVQDANALHMLRTHGPNASITWAASGPYQAVKATAPAPAPVSAPGGEYEIVGYTPQASAQTAAPQPRQPSVEVLPPLSEPPSEPKAPEKTFKGFLENVTTGVGRVLEPLTDPAGTLENVTNLIQGMSEKSGFKPVMGQPKQQMVDAIVNLYKHRYGSLEGFKNAWYDDPVGMAGDVAMVFSGAGLGVKAAQEFLEASGVAEHAAQIAEILPKVPAGAAAETRVQAGVNGAVDALGKRYMEVLEGGMKQAPSGVLGGPHGMLAAAKYGAAKKAVEILKDGWKTGTAAYDAPAGAAAAAEEAAAAATPKAAAAPAVAKTPGQVYAESEGHDWAALSADHKQLMEQIARAQENVAAQPPPPATPPAAPQAAPAAPEAPAATQEPPAAPIVPEAPQTQVPAASVEKLTDYVLSKKIAPHMVDKLPAEYWQWIADKAETTVPTADEIAQIQQNVAEKSIAAQGERTFQEQKAAVESEMTPPKETPPSAAPPAGGVLMEPLPENIPPHYLEHYAKEGLNVTQRDFAKDLRITDYVLNKADRSILGESMQGKGITPEEFESLPLEQQNKLIREAPTASGRAKHYPYLENPGPGKGRPAAVGIRHITDTMRWRQAQQAAAKGNP